MPVSTRSGSSGEVDEVSIRAKLTKMRKAEVEELRRQLNVAHPSVVGQLETGTVAQVKKRLSESHCVALLRLVDGQVSVLPGKGAKKRTRPVKAARTSGVEVNQCCDPMGR